MNHSTKVTFALMASLALIAGACAKKGADPSVAEKNGETSSNLMTANFQLPVPGNTYAYSSNNPPPSSAPIAGTNVVRVQTIVDSVAAPLKESNHGLKQTLDKGQYLQGALHVTLSALKSDLSGSRQDSQGVINWTYKLNDVVIFSGNTTLAGTGGDVTFATSALNAQPALVHWSFLNSGGQISKNLTVNQTGAGNLGFTSVFAPNSTNATVTFTGHTANSNFTGKWDSSGGYLQEGTNAKQCWNAQLQDMTCAAAQ